MTPRDNARVRARTAQGGDSAAGVGAAQCHIYRSPAAGPLLLHVPTSRLFSVSPALADYLAAGARAPKAPDSPRKRAAADGEPGDELPRALAELESLCRPRPSGQQAAPVGAGDMSCVTTGEQPMGGAEAPHPESPRPRWGDLTLFITDRCNLRCEYCFESYAPLRQAGRTISRETAGAALDFFFDRLYPDADVYDLHLFGGEPLLAWDMVEGVTTEAQRRAAAKGKPVYMSISTNAIGLTAKQAAFLREHEFDVSVSFDGPPEAHDAYRKSSDGRGSLARTRKGLAHLLDGHPPAGNVAHPPSGVSLRQPPFTSVAGRLHRANTDVFKSFLAAYELTQGKHGIAFTLARLSPGHPLSLRDADIEDILASYRRLVDWLVEQTAKGEYGYLSSLIIGNDYLGRFVPRLKTRSRGARRCGAGLSLFVVATDGGLYPCRSLVGGEQYLLGDVWQGIDEARHEPWFHLGVDERQDCRDCWARYLCGGGCYAQAAIACGTPARPNPVECRYTRGMIELAMELLARVESEAPGRLDDALAEMVFSLPEKHRIFVPQALQAQLGAPRIEAVEIEPRVAPPGGLIRGRVAVRTRRPLAAVTIYDSGGGSRALTPESEAGANWPQTLWFSGVDVLRPDAPIGRYWVGIAAADSAGAVGRAFTHVDVVGAGAQAGVARTADECATG